MRPDRGDKSEFRERRGPGGLGGGRRISDQEFNTAIEFFRAHSKECAAVLDGLEPVKKNRFKQSVVSRYESIKTLEPQNPELYQIKLRQLQLEDKIFALKCKHSDATPKSPEAQKIRDEIRQVVGDLVRSRVEERNCASAESRSCSKPSRRSWPRMSAGRIR